LGLIHQSPKPINYFLSFFFAEIRKEVPTPSKRIDAATDQSQIKKETSEAIMIIPMEMKRPIGFPNKVLIIYLQSVGKAP